MTFTEEDFAAPQFTEADFADQPAKFTEADFADKSRALTPDQLDAIIKRSQPERFNSFGDEAGVKQDDLLREVVNNPGKVIATPFKIAGNLPLAIGADAMNAVVGPGLPFTQTRKTNLEAGETAGAINTENPLENIKAALRGDNPPVEETISRLPVGQRLPVGIVTGLTKAAPKIASLALFPEALPAQMAASGALFGLDDEGNFSVKEAGLMALLPGVSASGRLAVGKTIAKGVEAGVGGLENAAVQKALTIGGDQAVMNGYMLAMENKELARLKETDPERFWETIGNIVGQNLAFGVLHLKNGQEPIRNESNDGAKEAALLASLPPGFIPKESLIDPKATKVSPESPLTDNVGAIARADTGDTLPASGPATFSAKDFEPEATFPDGAPDPVTTALNKLRQQSSADDQGTGTAAGQINNSPVVGVASPSPEAPATKADVIDLAKEMQSIKEALANPFKPSEPKAAEPLMELPTQAKPRNVEAELEDARNQAKEAEARKALAEQWARDKSPKFEYTILDAVQENGGLGGPDLETAMREMAAGKTAAQVVEPYGGEYNELADALETIFEARRNRTNNSQANMLAKAYELAGFGGNRRGVDKALEGIRDATEQGLGSISGLPVDEGALIADAWEAGQAKASGTRLLPKTIEGKTELFWETATQPENKIGLKRVNISDLKPGDSFWLKGKGLSHAELTVRFIDPETGEVQVKDGPTFGTQDLPPGTEIYVQNLQREVKHAAGDFSFDSPESVADQKARQAREAKARADADKLAERKAYVARGGDKLTGSDIDTNKEMFGAEVKQDKAGQGSLFAAGDDAKNLVAVHNTTSEKLAHMLKMGGLPVPSVGIVRADKAILEGFGDITLVGTPELVTPSKDTKVLNADAYSPRYPAVHYFPDPKGVTAVQNLVSPTLEKLPPEHKKQFSKYNLFNESPEKEVGYALKHSVEMQLAYLDELGQLPKFTTAENTRYQQGHDHAMVRGLVEYNDAVRPDFDKWVDDKLAELEVTTTEKMFRGFTNSGNRSYLPHNLDNVVMVMKKGFANAEGFNYGVGSIRASTGKQFRSLEGIRSDRDKITTKAAMDDIKKQVDEEFIALADDVMPRRANEVKGFGRLEAFSDDMKAMAEGGAANAAYLSDMYPGGAPFAKMRAFLDKLKNLPTEYFEAKVKRAVQLQEFSGAVVTEGTSPELIEKLKKSGLTVKTYPKNDAEARRAAVESIGQERNALFAKGAGRGLSEADATEAIQSLLGVDKLPPGIRVVRNETAPWGARIEGRNTITVNAAQISTPERARRVILEEGLHGVWSDPAVQRAWASVREQVTAAEMTAERAKRQAQGLPTDAATIREEAAIARLIEADANKGAMAKLYDAIRAAFKRVFGFDLPATDRQALKDAAMAFLRRDEGQQNAKGDVRAEAFADGDRPERERSAEAVKTELTEAEAALKDATREVSQAKDRGGKSNAETRQAAALAAARYRTLRDELLHHPEYIAEQLAKQHEAITQANKIVKPHGIAVRPDELADLAKLHELLTPQEFSKFQEIQGRIDESYGELQRMPKKMVARIQGEMEADGRLPKPRPLVSNPGRSLDNVTDWLRANGVDSPKLSLVDRLNLSKRFADMAENTKTSLQKAKMQANAIWKAAVESYKSPPNDSDFRHVIKSWIYADQRTGLATHQFVKELVKQVPNSTRRKAMAIWLDADGDMGLLRFQADSVPDAYRDVWKAALKLTDGEKQLAMKIKQDFADKLDDGIKVGIIDQGREDYGVPQRWKIKPELGADQQASLGDKRKGTAGRINSKLDPRSPFFSFQRETPSYFDGLMAKGVPENLDVAHLVATYDAAFHKTLSSRGMIAALMEAKAKDGLPVVKLSGSASEGNNADGKAYFVDSKAWSKADVAEDGRPYQSLDHSALKGWKLAFKDESGNPIIVKGDMLIHPDHYAYLKNELGQSALREVAVVRGLMKSQAFLKASKLSASFFHLVTIGEHMASHLVNPFLNGFKIDLRNADQSLLVRNGLELGMSQPQMFYEEGLASAHSGLFNQIPGLGDASAKITDWMFKEYIPAIMMKAGLHALENNRARYGDKLTPDQVAELTASQMNAAGGLMNYRLRGADGNMWAQLGANKTWMDLQRMALMAPQFLEARARVVGQALKPYGMEQRKMLILQAGILYVGARVLNQLLDNDPHWNDNPFSVVYKSRAYSIRTIVGDFWHMLTQPASFAAGRLSPLSRIGIESVTGRDLRTGARKQPPIETNNAFSQTAQNIVVDLANWLTPITVEGMLPGAAGREQTLSSMALSSVGVGSRKFTASMEIHDLAKDFNLNSEDKATRNAQNRKDAGAYAQSPYRKLDALLDAGELDKAKQEIKALQADGKTLDQIASRYERNFYYTGSAAREQDFYANLTPKQKEIYQKARAESATRATTLGKVFQK